MKYTLLSKCIWSLKNQGLTPIFKWRISKVSPKYCKLGLTENILLLNLFTKATCLTKDLNLLVNVGIKISCSLVM